MKTKNFKEQYNEIKNVVKSNRFVADRAGKLAELGYEVQELAMGAGGVLQIKEMRDGTIRVQIGYGHGRYNYAMCVVIDKPLS